MPPAVLVTGAAGFVGGRVAGALLDAGHAVTGIDSFDPVYPRWIKQRALDTLRPRAGFRFVRGDVRDAPALRRALEGVGAVVHAAGRGGVRASVGAPAAVARANACVTAALLAGCRAAGVGRLVLLSSSSVYGAAPVPFREDRGWLRPASPYAASKRAAELVARAAVRRGGTVAVLRLFSVYGPGQRPDQALARFAARLAAGEAVEQYGDGSARRDLTYVGDVADAVVRAVAWTARAGPAWRVINVGAGQPVTVAELRARLAAALGCADRVQPLPPATGDVPATLAATGRAARELGWRATTPLAEGLAAFAHWFEVTHGRPARTTARSGA